MKDCNQCGKCCINYGNGGLSASASELEFWEVFRPHIFRYVSNGKIWMSPDTGEQLERCPWLREAPVKNKSDQVKYTCDIYYDRPDDCKHYPVTIEQMVSDECEMIEVRDMDNLKQAQRTLDQIMIDSRPSFSS
jgi:uncharacterized protein